MRRLKLKPNWNEIGETLSAPPASSSRTRPPARQSVSQQKKYSKLLNVKLWITYLNIKFYVLHYWMFCFMNYIIQNQKMWSFMNYFLIMKSFVRRIILRIVINWLVYEFLICNSQNAFVVETTLLRYKLYNIYESPFYHKMFCLNSVFTQNVLYEEWTN